MCGSKKLYPNAFKSDPYFRTITSLAGSLVPEASAFALKFCCQACYSNLPSHLTIHKVGGHIVVNSLDREAVNRACVTWRIFLTLLRKDHTPINPELHFIGYLPVYSEALHKSSVQVKHVVEEWLPEASNVLDQDTEATSQHTGISAVRWTAISA